MRTHFSRTLAATTVVCLVIGSSLYSATSIANNISVESRTSGCSAIFNAERDTSIPELKFPDEGFPVLEHHIYSREYFKLRIPGAIGGEPPIRYRLEEPLPKGIYYQVTPENDIIIYGAYLEDQRTPWNAISTGALPPIGYTLIAEDSSGQTERLTFDFTYNLHTISWKGRPYDPLDQEVFFPNYGFRNETISLPWSSINSDYSDFGRTPEHTNIETFNLEGLDIEAELRTRSINNNGYDQNLPFLILRKTSGDRIAPTRKEVRVTITDYDGRTVSFYLDIYISDPNPTTSPRDLPDSSPRFNSSVEPQEWRMGEYVSLPLPKASGGNGKLNYQLVEPFGWSYRAFREIEGNLVGKVDPQDVTTSSGTFQYQVTDSDGDSDILEIPVNIVSSELEISHDLSDTVFRAQEELLFVELPTPIGGDGRYTFQLTPSLPNGLLIMDFDQLDP